MIIESEADLAAKVCILTKQLGSPKVTSTEDYISTMSFSQCGRYYGLGDQSGRLIIFGDYNGQLKYFTEIAAHKDSHDWQTNRQVAARINSVHWLQTHNNLQILTCNHKYIRIWRVSELTEKQLDTSSGFIPEVLTSDEVFFKHSLKSQLPDLHYGRIFHTALSKNQQTLITVDSDRFFRWNLERTDTAQILFHRTHCPMQEQDKQWASINDVTSVKFYLGSDNRYAYSTKTGAVHYIDLRETSNNKDSILFQSQLAGGLKDLANSKYLQMVSDFAFTGEYQMVTRNYLKMKVWDMRKAQKPHTQSWVYPAMLSRFGAFMTDYGKNYLTDIFRLQNVGKRLITNHYDNSFHLFNLQLGTNHRVKIGEGGKPQTIEIKKKGNPPDEVQPQPKIECVGYHPDGKKVAVSTQNCVYFFDTYNY